MTSRRLVLVADRHLLDSELLVRRLGDEIDALAVSADAVTSTALADAALVLLDGDGPVETFDAAVAAGAAVGVLHDHRPRRDRAAHAATRVSISRHAPSEELRSAVATALDGGTHKAASVSTMAAPSLSPRENQVLVLLAEGLANRDIADRLEISQHTVRTHVQALLTKLDMSNRVAAVGAARRAGLLPR